MRRARLEITGYCSCSVAEHGNTALNAGALPFMAMNRGDEY
jgi:hypothetical protein